MANKPQASIASCATISTQVPLSSLNLSFDAAMKEKPSTPAAHDYGVGLLERMCVEIERITRQSELERRRLYVLNGAIKQARTMVREKRFKIRQSRADDPRTRVMLRSLRNALETATAKLHTGQQICEEYKKAIDNVRRESIGLDQVYIGVVANLRNAPSTIDISEQEKQEIADSGTKRRELEKYSFSEKKKFLNTILKIGGHYREQENIQRLARRQRAIGRHVSQNGYVIADEGETYSATSMYRRIVKLSFLNCIQRHHIKRHQKNIEVFEQAFSTIKISTGIMNIGQIQRILASQEERNFSLISYANTLNREAQSYIISTACVEEIDSPVEMTLSRRQMEASLPQLELKLQRTMEQTSKKVLENTDHARITRSIFPLIQGIYRMIVALEEEPANVEIADIPTILDRVLEIVKFYTSEKQTSTRVSRSHMDKKTPLRMLTLPSFHDEDDDEDALLDGVDRDSPHSRTELKRRVENSQKKMKRDGQRSRISRVRDKFVRTPPGKRIFPSQTALCR